MFLHRTRLQHILRPHHYFDPSHYRREIARLFVPSWQFVCVTSELSNDGDFITLERFGTPVLVRNFKGQLKAFQNVCPHRHSMLTCVKAGNMPNLKCQYHGWEFNEAGRTGRIPEPKNFRPWDRDNAHLRAIHLETIGDLVFLKLSDGGPALKEWFEPLDAVIADSFAAPRWQMKQVWNFDCRCNWKVPTENTLESYHVAEVHPKWFGGGLPDEQSSHHTLDERYTTLRYDCIREIDRKQTYAARTLGHEPTGAYCHFHFHPNIWFVTTDTFNYLATCIPTSPTTCEVQTRMFALWGAKRSPWASFVRQVAWRIGRRTMYMIFNEDRAIFESQQRGLAASDRPGVIGVREERIHTFQRYIRERTE